MNEQTNQPGPGRSTADAAFSAAKKLIAERNEAASKAARKLRQEFEQRQAAARAARDKR